MEFTLLVRSQVVRLHENSVPQVQLGESWVAVLLGSHLLVMSVVGASSHVVTGAHLFHFPLHTFRFRLVRKVGCDYALWKVQASTNE